MDGLELRDRLFVRVIVTLGREWTLTDVDDEEGRVEPALEHLRQVDLIAEVLGVVALGREVRWVDVVVRVERHHALMDCPRPLRQVVIAARPGLHRLLPGHAGAGENRHLTAIAIHPNARRLIAAPGMKDGCRAGRTGGPSGAQIILCLLKRTSSLAPYIWSGHSATIRVMARYVIRVNGRDREVDAEPDDSLLAILRYDCGLTGSRYGCGEGQCGACTVLLDGAGARSCVTRVASIGTKAITTIEALADGDHLHPVQQAFLEAEAFQCGYCTSGMIMATVGLLRTNPNPSEAGCRTAARWQRLPLRTYLTPGFVAPRVRWPPSA